MREIILDGGAWKSPHDIYDSFFTAVGAPSWHGRNFNALHDSIATGQINKIEIPYLVRIKNYASIAPGARCMAADFVGLIQDMHRSGILVNIAVDD